MGDPLKHNMNIQTIIKFIGGRWGGGGQPLPLDNSTNMNLSIKIMVGDWEGALKEKIKI